MQSIKELNLKANHNRQQSSLCFYALYAIYQRTQSESKSQHVNFILKYFNHCMQSIKELNLKANHNIWFLTMVLTTLYAIYQRTQSESKSQQILYDESQREDCMQSIKELNLKANHNGCDLWNNINQTVCNLSKNSIWKQITTDRHLRAWWSGLYAIYQRTQSESKSQLQAQLSPMKIYCMQSIKELNLKANHNLERTLDF